MKKLVGVLSATFLLLGPAAFMSAETKAAPAAQPATPAAPPGNAPGQGPGTAGSSKGLETPAAPVQSPGTAGSSKGLETPADGKKADAPLDVTVTGVSKDEVPLEKKPPALDVPFQDVASFSRDGQTESVLAQSVEYLTATQRHSLAEIDSRQNLTPLPVKIAQAPFFRFEVPQGLITYTWEFTVVDENNATVSAMRGTTLPQTFLEWSGFDGGAFKIRPGSVYSPYLTVTDLNGKSQRTFGNPIQLDVLRFEQDGLIHLELSNDRLFERAGADFSREMLPLLQATLDILRVRVGTAFRVTVYETPEGRDLAEKRLQTVKKFLNDNLILDPKDLALTVTAPKDRGKVTEFLMNAGTGK